MTLLLINIIWVGQCLLGFFSQSRTAKNILIVLSIGVAAYYASSLAADRHLYSDAILNYGSSNFSDFFTETIFIEPVFLLVTKVLNRVGADDIYVFVLFALGSVPLKINLIRKLSRDIPVSLATYFSYFFLIHDSTQIRASLGIAVAYWSLYALSRGKTATFIVSIVLAAVTIHFSCIAFLFALLFKKKSATNILVFLILLVIALYTTDTSVTFLFDYLITNFDTSASIGLTKLASYVSARNDEETFDVLSVISIFSIGFAFVIKPRIKTATAFEVLCYNSFLFSIFISFLFYDFGVIQTRLRSIFAFSMVFLTPFLIEELAPLFKSGRETLRALFFLSMAVFFEYFAIWKELLINP